MGAFLIGLGVWQLQRLAWKTAILAEINERINANPQSLPPQTAWPTLKPDDYEYRHVAADGIFDHTK
jgi:surfeit locus 1 family protein